MLRVSDSAWCDFPFLNFESCKMHPIFPVQQTSTQHYKKSNKLATCYSLASPHRSLVYLRKWCNKMSSKAVYNSLQEMHVVISASELLHKEDIKSILIGYFHLRGCFFTNNLHRCRLESSGQLFNFFR